MVKSEKIKDEILGIVSVLSTSILLKSFSYTKWTLFLYFTRSTARNYGGCRAYLSDLA